MSKQFIKTMILILSMVVLLLTSLLVYGIISWRGTIPWNFSWNIAPSSIQKEAEVSIDNCGKIALNFSSASVEVSTSNASNLKVVEEANGTLRESEKFTIGTSGNTIEIKDNNSWSGFQIFKAKEIKIKLYIPENYNKDLEIRTASGNVTFFSDMNLNNIKCNQVSGNFNCSTTISARNIDLSITSGNINANNLQVKTYNISNTSGNTSITSLSGSGNVKCISGNIKITYTDILDETTVSSTSGNINLSVAEGISFEFYGQCTSGKISSNLDLNYKDQNGREATAKVGKELYKKINAKTVSGNIKIYN